LTCQSINIYANSNVETSWVAANIYIGEGKRNTENKDKKNLIIK